MNSMNKMSSKAWFYLWFVIVIGSALTVFALAEMPVRIDWTEFSLLILLAATSQLITARAPSHQSYHITLVFLMAGVIHLSPGLFVLLVMISHLGEWLKERMMNSSRLRQWYLQPVNISVHVTSGMLAYAVYSALLPGIDNYSTLMTATAVLFASLVYLLVNHILIGVAVMMARRVSMKESEVFGLGNLVSDYILLLLGAVVAIIWTFNPWIALLALAPLVMMYQALQVPLLKKQATVDDKTGLWNSRHFMQLFTIEMKRAARFSRPLTFIMADLDLLRNINNTYGHLAGDAVLAGVGRIIKDTIREYDVAGRFGGEEFAIALPETNPNESKALAERMRKAVQDSWFEIPTSSVRIQITMSFGLASFPSDASTIANLIHRADIAVYQAKLSGRNKIVLSTEVLPQAETDFPPVADRATALYPSSFEPRPSPAM